ncbi:MAG: RNA polymerase sigma-54 factor [Myxococcales bacterium]|nr:RNA polymerase sigma-54 factor [Myxococcales bacterium]
MYPSLQQNLKVSQQLRMTPQLQQAVKLLQYNRAELSEFIAKELEENPTLERNEDRPEEVSLEEANYEGALQEKSTISETSKERVEATENQPEIDWNRVDLNDRVLRPAPPSRQDDLPGYDQTLTREDTLSEHLVWQLRMQPLTPEDFALGVQIIGNLDDRGYFTDGLEGWNAFVAAEALDGDQAEAVRQGIMLMDPLGAGALDLRECLLLQLQLAGHEGDLAWRLVADHLEDLGSLDLRKLARSARVSVEELEEAKQLISMLEPCPGRPFTNSETERNPFITPDVCILKQGGEWVVHLNEDGMPRLRVSKYYQTAYRSGRLAGEERNYVVERLRRAEWVTKSILQRQQTIRKVVTSLLRFQRDFFERGPAHLKPLVLKDVAEDIGMHESTVSRVTSNKYAETPQGLFELKYFFSARIQSLGGREDVSAEAVRQRIGSIVGREDCTKPYSDSDLVRLLRAEGIDIARRTVAKYREQLRIPAAGKRRVRR